MPAHRGYAELGANIQILVPLELKSILFLPNVKMVHYEEIPYGYNFAVAPLCPLDQLVRR
jgi:hypothetical protein